MYVGLGAVPTAVLKKHKLLTGRAGLLYYFCPIQSYASLDCNLFILDLFIFLLSGINVFK